MYFTYDPPYSDLKSILCHLIDWAMLTRQSEKVHVNLSGYLTVQMNVMCLTNFRNHIVYFYFVLSV